MLVGYNAEILKRREQFRRSALKKTLGVVMDPIEGINYRKDTTLALLIAAQQAGYEIYSMEQTDLFIENCLPKALMTPIKVFEKPDKWYEKQSSSIELIEKLDVILMRKDPPFDSEYIYSTYILEAAEKRGCIVVNRPSSLRDCNEKIFATEFPECTPPILVSRDKARLKEFLATHNDVVLKPLDGMGGKSIFRVQGNESNVNVILETLTQEGFRTIMAQKYIPEIAAGDKRILIIGGEVIPYCLARLPGENDFRGNLAVGGTGIVQPLTERDRWIANQVAPELTKRGLFFVGLDVIGNFLTEINVTSPTCAREIERSTGLKIGSLLISAIDKYRNEESS